MKSEVTILSLLVAAALSGVATDGGLSDYVSEKVLPFTGENASASAAVARELQAEDMAADAAWQRLATKAEYDAYRMSMHKKMLSAMGVFPKRTPLNARTVAKCQKDGYSIEKVIFESRPSLPVTANLFIPDGAKKRPVVVMSCGHAADGKDCDVYLRACVLAVKRGFVALMFDPYFQGERREPWIGSSTTAHCQLGQRAELLDESMPLLRVWDGMRAIDYVVTRPEVDAARIGYMGQSGGGTMTALMMASDLRIRAAAPSCYLTSLRDLCHVMGPQDAEQNIFGQLAFGLNHTGYVLIPDIPVAVTVKYGDMFPFSGVQTLMSAVRGLEKNVGLGNRTFLNAAPGPHGWVESTETTSVDFLAQALIPGCENRAPDADANRMLDFGFKISSVDQGLLPQERGCTPTRCTLDLADAKSPFELLAEKAAKVRKGRPQLSAAELSEKAIRLAVIGQPDEREWLVKSFAVTNLNGIAAERVVFVRRGGEEIVPAVLVNGSSNSGSPEIVAAWGGRANGFALAKKAIAEERPVLIADLAGIGETEKPLYIFYGRDDRPDEGLGAMCYLLGKPLVGRRAGELLVLAKWVAKRFGSSPALLVSGPLAIPAAHAFAADRSVWQGVEIVNRPISWQMLLEHTPGSVSAATYADLVPHAYLDYDWPELLGR